MSEPPPPSNSSTPKNDSSEARPSLADDLSALKLRGAVKNNPLFRKFESDNQNRLNKDTNKVTLFANEARVNTGRISSVKESVASVGAQQQPLSPKPVVSPSPTVKSNPFKLADNRRLSLRELQCPETSFQQTNNEQIGPDSSMLLLDTSTSLPHFMNDGIDVSFIAPDALPSASPLDSSRSEILDSTGQDCSGLVVIQDSVSAETKLVGLLGGAAASE
ncbi:hypothetical protein BCR33DRAFT_796727 [Rhizoclosmatium globosum]|uniref:Uncharacterized protein n=1 Tax=Rhizoclosmatium globosum TaxID=329046 RepID=A0A1Y2AL97_9FUNG|nr:hypothetical protein BCR33DRAFT_796727 [Rhizoclosmatium globosum]|eukprot:ORY22997.1 hypothetical protein BCR33DRAFT_796727 [Rhizoclosmatium globosum]